MNKEVAENVRELIANILQQREIELVDVIYRRESNGMVLRLLVDKENGITLDECAYLNEKIGELLDAEDTIPDKYILEVSSPGLDRPLKTRRDFEKVMGKIIHVHTYEPIEERRKDVEGELKFVDDQKVVVDRWEIQLKKISKAKLKIDV